MLSMHTRAETTDLSVCGKTLQGSFVSVELEIFSNFTTKRI
jgi:hypothetical protein